MQVQRYSFRNKHYELEFRPLEGRSEETLCTLVTNLVVLQLAFHRKFEASLCRGSSIDCQP